MKSIACTLTVFFLLNGFPLLWRLNQQAIAKQPTILSHLVQTALAKATNVSSEAVENSSANSHHNSLTYQDFVQAVLSEAHSLAMQVEPIYKSDAWTSLAIAYAKTDNSAATTDTLENAIAALPPDSAPKEKAEGLITIAQTFYRELGEQARMFSLFDEALRLAQHSDVSLFGQLSLLNRIGAQYVEAQSYERLYQLPNYASYPYTKASLERSVVYKGDLEKAIKDGQGEQIRSFILNANFGANYFSTDVSGASTPPIEEIRKERLEALRYLIKFQQEANNTTQVEALIALYSEMVSHIPTRLDQAREHIQLGQSLHNAGDRDRTLYLLDQASQILAIPETKPITDPASYAHSRATSEVHLARLYFKAGNMTVGNAIAQDFLVRAQEQAQAYDALAHAYRLKELAETLFKFEQTSLAKQTLRQAEHIVISAENEPVKSKLPPLVEIATVYINHGHREDAQRLMPQLQQLYSATEATDVFLYLTEDWIHILVNVGQIEQALEVANDPNHTLATLGFLSQSFEDEHYEQATTILENLESPMLRLNGLLEIGMTLAAQEQRSQARHFFEQAFSLSQDPTVPLTPSERENALPRIVGQYARVVEPAQLQNLIIRIESVSQQADFALSYLPPHLARPFVDQLSDPEAQAVAYGQLASLTATDGCFQRSLSDVTAINSIHNYVIDLTNIARCYYRTPNTPITPEMAQFLRRIS